MKFSKKILTQSVLLSLGLALSLPSLAGAPSKPKNGGTVAPSHSASTANQDIAKEKAAAAKEKEAAAAKKKADEAAADAKKKAKEADDAKKHSGANDQATAEPTKKPAVEPTEKVVPPTPGRNK